MRCNRPLTKILFFTDLRGARVRHPYNTAHPNDIVYLHTKPQISTPLDQPHNNELVIKINIGA
jgi:hypothetical protein